MQYIEKYWCPSVLSNDLVTSSSPHIRQKRCQMLNKTPEQSLFTRIVTRKGVPIWGRRTFWGYVMILPFIVHLVLFTGGPLIASLLLSFTRWNFGRPPRWIGSRQLR